MSVYDTLNYSVARQVATIELNRPEVRNAFNQQMRFDLLKAIRAAESDETVRVVVICGAGKGFSAGADLAEGPAGHATIASQIEAEYKPFLTAIEQSPKLFVAAVNGTAAGIGGALALRCDFTVMGASASLYQAFAPIALVPDGGATWLLGNALGYKRALQMFVEAERLPAARCLELGLVNHVFEDERLREDTQAWAERLAQGAPIAQHLTKQLLRQAMGQSYEAMIDAEALAQNRCTTSKDFQIGVKAVFSKQTPAFIGA